ncbi:MAG: ABC transporter ATP-binding protein/permease [Bacteroidales bacterium]|nr:ABC transporter ATP-binding protein/permease [Bacteroidales bacterium]
MLKKIAYLLSKRDRKILIGIFLVILGSAFLDLVGISAILPVVEILVTPEEVIETNTFVRIINNVFQLNGNANNLCFVCLGCMAVLFLFKCAYAIFRTYLITRFTMSYSRRLTKKLMTAYLLFPYEFHLDNNSSTLIRKSTYDVDLFTNAVTNILDFVVKIATIITLAVFLFIQDWKVTLILTVLILLFSFVVLKIVKPKSKKYGKELQNLNSDNYKYLSQAFNGIKESKIGNSEGYFTNVYDKNRIKINNLGLKRVVLNSVPGHTLELIGMLGICLALAIVILVGTAPSQIVITFSVFAYAVIKLLPSVTAITTVVNNLQFYETSVNSLYEDIKTTENVSYIESNDKDVKTMPFENEISVNNVSFYYKSLPDRVVLKDINLNIKKNSSVAFSGASGAGKTTMIDLLLGLLPCREGSISCDGINIVDNMRGWRKNISYIPQNIYLSDDTIRNNVAFGIEANKIDDAKIWDSLEKAQLKEYVERLPNGLDTVIGERGVRMSGGQRQRIGIARAFYRNTNIIVFDEATSALDYETEKNILEHVSQYSSDHTLIIITHRLNTIDSCDCIFKVEDGHIIKIK